VTPARGDSVDPTSSGLIPKVASLKYLSTSAAVIDGDA
jgi:hypothetical protein